MMFRGAEIRLYGWCVIALVKLCVITSFHLLSLSVGRGGLAPNILGGDDGDLYLYMAEEYALTGSFPLQDVYYLWPHVAGKIMAWTGWTGTLPFKALLLAATFATAALGIRLLRMLCQDLLGGAPPPWAEALAAAVLVLFPSTLWVTSYSIYRDGVLYALAMASMYGLYRLLVRRERWALLWLVPSLVLLFEFRWYAALAFALGALLWFPVTGGVGRRKSVRYASAFGVVLAVAVLIQQGAFDRIQEYAEFREYFHLIEAGSNIGVSYATSPLWMWPPLFLYSLVSNVLGPLPHQINSGTTAAGFFLEVPALAFVVWRLARSPLSRRPEALLLILVAAAWFGLIAFYNDNLGTALRLRVLGFQFLFLIAILDGVARRARPRTGRVPVPRRRAIPA